MVKKPRNRKAAILSRDVLVLILEIAVGFSANKVTSYFDLPPLLGLGIFIIFVLLSLVLVFVGRDLTNEMPASDPDTTSASSYLKSAVISPYRVLTLLVGFIILLVALIVVISYALGIK